MPDASSPRRRALFVVTYSMRSPYRLGSHHICNQLLDLGWEVTLVTHPLKVWSVFSEYKEKANRLTNIFSLKPRSCACYREYSQLVLVPGISFERHSKSFGSIAVPQASSIISERELHRGVDLIYMDNFHQPQWVQRVPHECLIYRMPDNPEGYGPLSGSEAASLRRLVGAADLTVCHSGVSERVAHRYGARKVMVTGNGIDLSHFSHKPPALPSEYPVGTGPVVLYLGALDKRVDVALLAGLVQLRPQYQFFVVGDVKVRGLPKASNLHCIGSRPYESIPGYIHGCDMGIVPFDVEGMGELVNSTSPLKLLQFLACEKPVVSTSFEAARTWPSVRVVSSQKPEDFAKVMDSLVDGSSGQPLDDLKDHSWRKKTADLLDAVGLN